MPRERLSVDLEKQDLVVGPVRDTGGPRRDAIDVVFAPEKHTTVGRVSMRDASLVQTSESAPISSRDDVLQPAHTKIRA